jgi:hypothetical protein
MICLSVDAMLGSSAVALAAAPIIALRVMALTLDMTKLTRKTHDSMRARHDATSLGQLTATT